MERFDLGVCEGLFFRGDPKRTAVVLPGAFYVPAAPLLWFASRVLGSAGWSVLQVWDRRTDDSDPLRWVDDRLEAALAAAGGHGEVLVVAKSITSLAAPRIADLSLPAVWLTPLLNQAVVRDGLESATAPRLLAGGTADPTWDSPFAAALADATVVEIPGANHAIEFPEDHRASLSALGVVADAIAAFAADLS